MAIQACETQASVQVNGSPSPDKAMSSSWPCSAKATFTPLGRVLKVVGVLGGEQEKGEGSKHSIMSVSIPLSPPMSRQAVGGPGPMGSVQS